MLNHLPKCVVGAAGLMCVLCGPVDAAGPLTWTPPALDHPLVLKIDPRKSYYGPFPDPQDILVELPQATLTNQVKIVGGRHLRVIGGAIKPRGGSTFLLRFVEVTGSVFIEGLDLDAQNVTGDGINVSGKRGFTPDVYLQNVRIMNINGFSAGQHADMFQPQGDIGRLRIDHLTGTSNYQGLFLRPEFRIAGVTIKNVNFSFLPNPRHTVTYLLWFRNSEEPAETYPVSLESVYIEPRAGQTVAGQAVFPSARSVRAKAVEQGGKVTWAPDSQITGCVISGKAPGGDFVPEGSAGLHYVSPGYRP